VNTNERDRRALRRTLPYVLTAIGLAVMLAILAMMGCVALHESFTGGPTP
jgi:hypothetical protein